METSGSRLVIQDDSDRSTLKEMMDSPWQRFIQIALMHHCDLGLMFLTLNFTGGNCVTD